MTSGDFALLRINPVERTATTFRDLGRCEPTVYYCVFGLDGNTHGAAFGWFRFCLLISILLSCLLVCVSVSLFVFLALSSVLFFFWPASGAFSIPRFRTIFP